MKRRDVYPQLAGLILVIVSLLTVTRGYAQPIRVQTLFERDVNRYQWQASTSIRQQMGSWLLQVEDRFASDAYMLFANSLTFRDENRLSFQLGRPLGGAAYGRLWGRSAWYSQSRVLSQEIYSGVRFQPLDHMAIEPAIGLAWDQRPGADIAGEVVPLRSDLGPALGSMFRYTPEDLAGYSVHVDGEGFWQYITPRRGRSLRLTSGVERVFEKTRISALFNYSSYRRDAYQAVSFLNRNEVSDRLSETVEATTSDTLAATLNLDAPLLGALRFTTTVDLGVNDRYVRTLRAQENALHFDTDFDRRSVDVEAALVHDTPRLLARLAVRRGAEVERRQLVNRDDLPPAQAAQKSSILEQADFDQGHVALLGRLRTTIGPRMVVSFDGSASLLRHDTPDANLDDRDEVYHTAQAGVLFSLSRYLQADVKLSGTHYHTIFLDATRSAENNIQRSVRLQPAFQWTPSEHTRFRGSSEVRATYTVDDFLLPGRRPSDQSAREIRYDASLEQDLGSNVRLLVDGSLSRLFLGRLLWDRFAEIPFDTLKTYSGWVRLQTGGRIVADLGVRFFIRSDFDRSVSVRYPRVDDSGLPVIDEQGEPLFSSISRPGRIWIEQVGPTCSITWPMRYRATLHLDGWFNVQHIRRRLFGTLPEANAERIRHAGKRGSRTIIPNVSLSVLWDL